MSMKPGQILVALILALVLTMACENRDVNEGERFRPRALNDNFNNSHFTKITIDGVEYLIMERDNNNPHEGFGFMAFRANKLIEKHDTAIAYLKTINHFQTRIYAKLYNISIKEAEALNKEVLNANIFSEQELKMLEKSELINEEISMDTLEID